MVPTRTLQARKHGHWHRSVVRKITDLQVCTMWSSVLHVHHIMCAVEHRISMLDREADTAFNSFGSVMKRSKWPTHRRPNFQPHPKKPHGTQIFWYNTKDDARGYLYNDSCKPRDPARVAWRYVPPFPRHFCSARMNLARSVESTSALRAWRPSIRRWRSEHLMHYIFVILLRCPHFTRRD